MHRYLGIINDAQVMYVITFAKGTSIHDEKRFQRRNVSAVNLAETISSYQAKGCRIVRVEEQN